MKPVALLLVLLCVAVCCWGFDENTSVEDVEFWTQAIDVGGGTMVEEMGYMDGLVASFIIFVFVAFCALVILVLLALALLGGVRG